MVLSIFNIIFIKLIKSIQEDFERYEHKGGGVYQSSKEVFYKGDYYEKLSFSSLSIIHIFHNRIIQPNYKHLDNQKSMIY